MIEEAFSFYAEVSKKFFPIIIILSIVIALVSLQEATKTEISTDVINFFYPDTPGMIEARKIESDFMGVDSVSILIEADRILAKDALEDDILEMTSDIVETMSTFPGVVAVTSVLDLGNDRDEIMDRPQSERSRYLSRDLEYSLITIKLDSAEVPDRAKLISAFQKTVDKVIPAKGSKVTLTGGLTTYYAWEEAVRSGFARSIITSAITIAIVLFFVFRSPITSSFIMMPILVAVFAAFGIMHFINIPLNFLTVMFGAVTLGLGVDYSIHLTERYYEELEKGKDSALDIALSKVGRNTVFTSLTTMAAFSSMAVAGLRMVAEYGFMSFIAITFSALSVLLFLPSYLILESKIGRMRFDLTRISNALGLRGILNTIMTKLSDFAVYRPIGVIFFISMALIPTFYGMSQIKTMTDDDMWLPQEMPAIKADKIVEKEFGQYGYTMILIEADDIRTPEIMKAMKDIEEEVRNVPFVIEITSLASFIGPLSEDKKKIEESISALPDDIKRQYVTEDYTESLILIKGDEEVKENYFKEIDEAVESVETPDDAVFTQAGFSKLFSQVDSIMEKDQGKTTMASLILVIILLYSALRGVMGIILGLAPVLLAIIFAMGTMGLLGVPSTPLTIMLATLLLGLGIDYGIHFMARYKEERENGETLENALKITSSTVGESIAVTSITTTFGFLSLMTMTLIPVQDFGKIAAIGLVLCAVLMPVVISVGLLIHERVVQRALVWLPIPGRS